MFEHVETVVMRFFLHHKSEQSFAFVCLSPLAN